MNDEGIPGPDGALWTDSTLRGHDIPDIHPNVGGIYRRKVERLAEALQHPQERDDAADAIRALIERITLTPGTKRGEIAATLHGDLGTILEWAAQKANTPGAGASGVSVSVVAGARNRRRHIRTVSLLHF